MAADATINGIVDLLGSPESARLGVETSKRLTAVLRDHRIELLFRPSLHPGEESGQRHTGAAPWQIEVREAAASGCRRMAVGGANRAGKTQGIGGAFAEHLRDRAEDGESYWIIAQDWPMMRKVPQRFLWDHLPRSMFPPGTTWTTDNGLGRHESMTLLLPDGRGEIYLSFKNEEMDIDKYESDKVSGAWWTEASREAVYKAMITRLADTRGFLFIDYLPKYGWLKYKVRKNPVFKFWPVAMKDNAHNLPDGTVAEVIAEYQGETSEIDVRVYGKEASAFGAVYPQFRTDQHVCMPFDLPATLNRYRCYDYGFRHPSALLWGAMLPMGFRVPKGVGGVWAGKELDREVLAVYREYYVTGRTVPTQAADIIELSAGEIYRPLKGRVVSDPSLFNVDQTGTKEAASRAKIFREHGIVLQKGKRASGPNGHALVSRVRSWFEHDQILFFDCCEKTIYEHEVWRHKETRDGDAPGNEPYEDKNNHTCDALKELLAESPTAEPPVAAIPMVDPSVEEEW